MVLLIEANDLGLFHDVAIVGTRAAALCPPCVLDVSSVEHPPPAVNAT